MPSRVCPHLDCKFNLHEKCHHAIQPDPNDCKYRAPEKKSRSTAPCAGGFQLLRITSIPSSAVYYSGVRCYSDGLSFTPRRFTLWRRGLSCPRPCQHDISDIGFHCPLSRGALGTRPRRRLSRVGGFLLQLGRSTLAGVYDRSARGRGGMACVREGHQNVEDVEIRARELWCGRRCNAALPNFPPARAVRRLGCLRFEPGESSCLVRDLARVLAGLCRVDLSAN